MGAGRQAGRDSPWRAGDVSHDGFSPGGIPGPRAIFTSNPLRGLDWLLEIWASATRPRVPTAELHVFSGSSPYGNIGRDKAARMEQVLARARTMASMGVV